MMRRIYTDEPREGRCQWGHRAHGVLWSRWVQCPDPATTQLLTVGRFWLLSIGPGLWVCDAHAEAGHATLLRGGMRFVREEPV